MGGARTKRNVENRPTVADVMRGSLGEKRMVTTRWVAGCGISENIVWETTYIKAPPFFVAPQAHVI